MAGEVESSREQCSLVERRRHDSVHVAGQGQGDGAIDSPPCERTGVGGGVVGAPSSDSVLDLEPATVRSNQHKLRGRPHAIIAEGGRGYFRADAAGIAERDGEPGLRAGHAAVAVRAPELPAPPVASGGSTRPGGR